VNDLRLRRIASQTGEIFPGIQAIRGSRQKEIEALTATVKEQAAQIQKVSAQLQWSKPVPQTVLNRQ
jgi:hypothetical protein